MELTSRRGVTLLELVVVLAIVGLMGSLVASDLSGLISRYRLNAAARDFAGEVKVSRRRAISDNREIALVLVTSDPNPADGNDRNTAGRYEIQVGNTFAISSSWDTVIRGVYDLADGPNAHSGISIEPWQSLAGPPGYSKPDSLVFSPRGYLINDPADFTGGVIRVVFRNKTATFTEQRVVRVRRGGTAQIAIPE